METALEPLEVTERDLTVKCPVDGCSVLMGTPLEFLNGRYELRVRTSAENDQCRQALLRGHFQGNH
jgi:hypothetical protein